MKKYLICFCIIINIIFSLFAMEQEEDLIPYEIKQNIAWLTVRDEKSIIELIKNLIKLSSCNNAWRATIQNEELWDQIFANFFMNLNFNKECQIIGPDGMLANCLILNIFKKITDHLFGQELENQLKKCEKVLTKIRIKNRLDSQKKISRSTLLFIIYNRLTELLRDSQYWNIKFGNFFDKNIGAFNLTELDLQIQKSEEFLRSMKSKEIFKKHKIIINCFASVLNEMKANYEFKKAIYHFDLVKAKDIINTIQTKSERTKLLNLNQLNKIFCQTEEMNEDVSTGLILKSDFNSIVLLNAISSGYNEIVELLLLNPYLNTNFQNYHGWTALMLASSDGNYKTVKKLIEAGADPNIKNKLGWTALIVASKRGHKKVVQILLENSNIMLNLKDNDGLTALKHASNNQHNEIAQMLINAGARQARTNSSKNLQSI